jgi:hypothetical protein
MPESAEETLVLINEELKGRLARQDATAARLDTKLTLVIGFVVTAIPLCDRYYDRCLRLFRLAGTLAHPRTGSR